MYSPSRRKITARVLLVLGLFAAAALPVRAQNSSDGSVYSRFGVGELRTFSSSQIQALGGGGTALPAFIYVNTNNPASLGDQVLTRASIGVLYQGLETTDADGNTSLLNEGTLNALQFSFPLLTQKLGIGLSFEPYSRVGYQVQSLGALSQPDPAPQDTADYLIRFGGSGGLQQVVGGVGYRLSPSFSLGASVNFLFGILEETREVVFLEPGYNATVLTSGTRLRGVTGTLGGLLTLREFPGDEDFLSLGATVTLPTSLGATRVRTLGLSADRDTLGAALEGDLRLPLGVGIGAAYGPDEHWLILVDGRYEPWSSFESDLPLPGYAPGEQEGFRDRLRASAGVQLYPAGNDQFASYLARIAYRLGFYYDEAYVAPREDIDLRTLVLTAGFSLPTLISGTRLDINLEAGTRGTTEADLVRDRFYRIALNVNFGERWFEKRKLR